MKKLIVVAALCAASGAWAQNVTLDFTSGVFGPGYVEPSLVYQQDGFTLRSEPTPFFSEPGRNWGNGWSRNGAALSSHAPYPMSADFTVTHAGDLFRYIAVDVISSTFDFCIWANRPGFNGAGGDGPSITGSLGGSLQFSTYARATSCTSFTTVFNGNVNTVIDSLTFSVPGLSFITIQNLALTTMVPEPQTWALMLAGFGLMGWAHRHRTQTPKPARM